MWLEFLKLFIPAGSFSFPLSVTEGDVTSRGQAFPKTASGDRKDTVADVGGK